MENLIKAIAVSAALLSSVVDATIISGTHTTAGGKTVALQGLEWLSLEHTMGLSRDTVEATGGFTDNYGRHYAEGYWRYATTLEVDALLRSIWGGVVGFSSANDDGMNWFSSTFQLTAFDSITGGTHNPSERFDTLDYGVVQYGEVFRVGTTQAHATPAVVLFDFDQSYSAYAFTSSFTSIDSTFHTANYYTYYSTVVISSFLVRDQSQTAQLPLPTPMFLMFLGLFGIGLTKRRKV